MPRGSFASASGRTAAAWLTAVSLFTLHASGCFFMQCGESLRAESKSSDGKHVAAVFVRDCGATTDYVTHVNLRRFSESVRPSASGTITGGEVFVVDGEHSVKLVWKEPRTLLIECPTCDADRTFKKEVRWGDVGIVY